MTSPKKTSRRASSPNSSDRSPSNCHTSSHKAEVSREKHKGYLQSKSPQSDYAKPNARPNSTANTETHDNAAHKFRKSKVAPAKKLNVRAPNQAIQKEARKWKDRRTGINDMDPMRLQKALAASGAGSRRDMEEVIARGLVRVNGHVAKLGDKVVPGDNVELSGKSIRIKWADRVPRIILYYKQEGEIVSRSDPAGRISVFDRLPQTAGSRWVSVGRLDINTSGLLILTTSGELANRLAHPRFEAEREYAVRVLGGPTDEQLAALKEGVMLEDGPAKVESIREQGGEGANKWFEVVLKEGRNREVRRLFEHIGCTVSRLVRTGFGPIALPNRLKRGQFYELNEFEVANVLQWSGMHLPGRAKKRR